MSRRRASLWGWSLTTCLAVLPAGAQTPSGGTREVSAHPHMEPGLPAPIAVCVEPGDGGAPTAGVAIPSRAGVYDPRQPVVPQHLNWMVAGRGCVQYPGSGRRRASCDGTAVQRPVVTRVLCQQ